MNNPIDGPSLVDVLTKEGTHIPPDGGDIPDTIAEMIAPLNDDALNASENEGQSLCLNGTGKCISCDSLRTEDAPRTVMGEGRILISSV
jgi:hypothetical protein